MQTEKTAELIKDIEMPSWLIVYPIGVTWELIVGKVKALNLSSMTFQPYNHVAF